MNSVSFKTMLPPLLISLHDVIVLSSGCHETGWSVLVLADFMSLVLPLAAHFLLDRISTVPLIMDYLCK